MYGKQIGASVFGIDGRLVEVEVDITSGLPQVNLVGLPDPAVRESVERVRAAIRNCGFTFPLERITINLAPADLRKEGTAFDLAIATSILIASAQLSPLRYKELLLLGELALDGAIRPVPGVLPMVMAAKARGICRVALPPENAAEAGLVEGMKLIVVPHLHRLAELEEGLRPRSGALVAANTRHEGARYNSGNSADLNAVDGLAQKDRIEPFDSAPDFNEVIGQPHAKRALLTAAAGRHNLLLCGPPGTGKTMLIRRLPGILPLLGDEEALEVTRIYSVAGKLSAPQGGLLRARPFRAPHHTISPAGLIGGGAIPRPGEVSLAHHGVLFLDELPEYARGVLESLRQPLEEQQVTLARARAVFEFPAKIMLAATMNPCPCGFLGDAFDPLRCQCAVGRINAYRAKISGPLLDRIDLQVEVPRPGQLSGGEAGTSSAQMRALVERALRRQRERSSLTGVSWNSELSGRSLQLAAPLGTEAAQMLKHAYTALGLSPRGHDRIIRLARTLADLDDREAIGAADIAEAIQYRYFDRMLHKLY